MILLVCYTAHNVICSYNAYEGRLNFTLKTCAHIQFERFKLNFLLLLCVLRIATKYIQHLSYCSCGQTRLVVVSCEGKKKQLVHAFLGLRDHYSELHIYKDGSFNLLKCSSSATITAIT